MLSYFLGPNNTRYLVLSHSNTHLSKIIRKDFAPYEALYERHKSKDY